MMEIQDWNGKAYLRHLAFENASLRHCFISEESSSCTVKFKLLKNLIELYLPHGFRQGANLTFFFEGR